MTQRRRVVNAVIKQVAEFLGNTPAVCRGSYIDPRVIDRYNEGMTIAPAIAALGPGDPLVDSELQVALEQAVIDLLEGTRFTPMVTKAA
jgi:DNA topoisomerase IB